MIEREDNIKDCKWTAERFKIEKLESHDYLERIVIDFIDPAIRSIRHDENPLAYRWYWSWDGSFPDEFYLRVYFLSHKGHFNKIWEKMEEFRKNLNGILDTGVNEEVLSLDKENREYGIFLEWVSEIALVLWGGGRTKEYGNALHHLWNPLLIQDQNGYCYLRCLMEWSRKALQCPSGEHQQDKP